MEAPLPPWAVVDIVAVVGSAALTTLLLDKGVIRDICSLFIFSVSLKKK